MSVEHSDPGADVDPRDDEAEIAIVDTTADDTDAELVFYDPENMEAWISVGNADAVVEMPEVSDQ